MKIQFEQNKVAAFCQKYSIKRISFFGSILRSDFNEDSDIDVLVEFEEGKAPGLKFFTLDEELSEILGGRKIDLVTPKALRGEERKREIFATAQVIYEQAA